MKVSNLYAVGDLRFEEMDKPVPGKGEVLVHIHACGICGSDVPRVFTKGTYHFPTVPGHEFAGVIEELGEGVDSSWIGKRVAVFPLLPCRECESCEKGNYAQCENYDYFGSRRDGGFAEYLAVPLWNLVVVPDNVSMEEAAMCEPAAVALHAVTRTDIKCGDNVLIMGAGAIGLMVGMWCKAAGASKVILADIDDRNLDYAKTLGFECLINSRSENVPERVQELTDREGVIAAFDCAGVSPAVEACLESVKMFGTVVTVGNPAGDINLKQSAYWNILRKELKVCGTWNSSYSGKLNDWKRVMKGLAEKKINVRDLITHRYPLEECNEAFEVLRTRSEFVVKVMFIMAEE